MLLHLNITQTKHSLHAKFPECLKTCRLMNKLTKKEINQNLFFILKRQQKRHSHTTSVIKLS